MAVRLSRLSWDRPAKGRAPRRRVSRDLLPLRMVTEEARSAESRALRRDNECEYTVLSNFSQHTCTVLTYSHRDDGTLEPRPAAHRLGPKANQGAINAGLRALDRSGKPCRKWNKGGFQLKTFTGVQWEIPRWTAPPKPKPVEVTPEAGVTVSGPVSADGSSSKENKENVAQPVKSDSPSNSNSGGDVEMQSVPSVQASSPAPMPIAAGA